MTIVSGMEHLGEIIGEDKGRGEAKGQMGLVRALIDLDGSSMRSRWRALTTRVA